MSTRKFLSELSEPESIRTSLGLNYVDFSEALGRGQASQTVLLAARQLLSERQPPKMESREDILLLIAFTPSGQISWTRPLPSPMREIVLDRDAYWLIPKSSESNR